jgi:hypothetical protein
MRTVAATFLILLCTALAMAEDDYPQETISFVCNSGNRTLNFVNILSTGKSESSAEPFTDGPLTLTLKFFEGKVGNEITKYISGHWDAELKSSGLSGSPLFNWWAEADNRRGNVLQVRRDAAQREIDRVKFSTPGRTLIITRDYKNYRFVAAEVDQTTEKEADEINIVVPNPTFSTRGLRQRF